MTSTIKAFDLGELGHLLKVNINEKIGTTQTKPEIIWIVDRSSSMGSAVLTITSQVIPMVSNSIGYANDDKVTVITFDSQTETVIKTVKQFEQCFGTQFYIQRLNRIKFSF